MAHKYKEEAVIIHQEEICPGVYSMWMHADKIALEDNKPGSSSAYTVRTAAGCCQGLSVSVRLIKMIWQCALSIVWQEKERMNFRICVPECR